MKIKIVNKKKFTRAITILVISILIVFVFVINSYSTVEIKYKEKYICHGDTLWSIAKEEITNNEYFKDKDIREVIYELRKINNLNALSLKEGDILSIPVLL